MNPPRRFPLFLIWLHWVVAHAATAGVFATIISTLPELDGPLVDKSQAVSYALLLMVPEFWMITHLEKVVLRGAGLEFGYWGLATFASVVMACFLSLVAAACAMALAWRFVPPWSNLIGILAGHVAFGIIVGGWQATQFRWTSGQQLMWTIASGAAALGIGGLGMLSVYGSTSRIDSTVIVTTMATIYGAITGLALVWIVKHPGDEMAPDDWPAAVWGTKHRD